MPVMELFPENILRVREHYSCNDSTGLIGAIQIIYIYNDQWYLRQCVIRHRE